jgi:hypothetical protein
MQVVARAQSDRFGPATPVPAPGRNHLVVPCPHSGHWTSHPNIAGGRPPSTTSDLRLLGNREGVIDLNAQVSHCRLQLGVSKQQLDGAQVLRAPIDQRRLGASHRVHPKVGAVQAELVHPLSEDPGVLPGSMVR